MGLPPPLAIPSKSNFWFLAYILLLPQAKNRLAAGSIVIAFHIFYLKTLFIVFFKHGRSLEFTFQIIKSCPTTGIVFILVLMLHLTDDVGPIILNLLLRFKILSVVEKRKVTAAKKGWVPVNIPST